MPPTSPELTKLSVDNTPKRPTVTPEGQAAASRIQAARQARNAGQVITPENLQPTPLARVTPPAQPTVSNQLQSDLEVQQDEFTQKAIADRAKAESGMTDSRTQLTDYIKNLSTPTQLQDQAFREAGGVDDISVELNDINDQMRREQLSLRRSKERILESGGGLAGGAQAEIGNLERASLAKQADLAVIQMAVQGRYDSAREQADRAVKAKLEHQTLLTEAAKFNYEENKEIFTRAEQREFETLLGNRERAIKEEADRLKMIQDLAIQAMQDGAPRDVVSRMQKAGTVEEATSIGGSFIGALDREAKRASTAASWALADERMRGGEEFTTPNGETVKVPTFEEWASQNGGKAYAMNTLDNTQMAELRKKYDDEVGIMEQATRIAALSPIAREVVNNPQAYYDLTPSVRGEIFEELAKKGIDTNNIISGKKKALPATQASDLAQAAGVKTDVEKLYSMLQSLPGTGPISGRLQGLNPYHPQRVAIDAQITRIIPGLARGIFQEVGVLTDQDMERYRQTLANPNMTDEQIELLHNDTLSKIDQSIGTTIDTFSSLGYDLGKFTDTLPITEPSDGLSDEEAYAEYLRITNQN